MTQVVLDSENIKILLKSINTISQVLSTKEDKQEAERNEILSVEEAAIFLKLEASSLRVMVSKRQIPFYKSVGGRKIYFLKGELRDYLLHKHFKPLYQLADEHIENLGNKKIR